MDLLCVAYNINPGYNEHIQKNSRVLSGYTTFVEKVHKYANQEMILKDALIRAIDECISEGILAEFFRKHRKEVIEMEALDFTFERREKLIRRDSLEEGLIAGRQEGEKIGLLKGKIELLKEMKYSISEIAAKLEVSEQKVQEILQQDNLYNQIIHKQYQQGGVSNEKSMGNIFTGSTITNSFGMRPNGINRI